MKNRRLIRRQITEIVTGEPAEDEIKIFYHNPITGEVTELKSYPDRSGQPAKDPHSNNPQNNG